TASGPVSFMRGADAWAGSIKSGGGTRRAAKMVVLDVDHPDIREFIWCKAKEEDKAAALRDAGFDMSIDGDGFHSIQYQNANNSVRVTDEFMQAVADDGDWRLIARTTGKPVGEPVRARDLMREIAEAAWRCADPGVQYASGQSVRCTPEHRFLTATSRWVQASDLQPATVVRAVGERSDDCGGLAVVTLTATTDVVSDVTTIECDEPIAVYDLEAEGL